MSNNYISTLESLANTEKFVPKPIEELSKPLSDKELDNAFKTLNTTSFVRKFPTRETRFADEPVQGQNICLISFVPAKGATPNEKGIYGFAKVRGSYPDLEQSNKRAIELIKSDSYHNIFHAKVGYPFPLTTNSKYAADTDEVDIKKDISDSISEDVKQKRKKEEETINDIKERERLLLEESKREKTDPKVVEDDYTTARVKKAQLIWTYLETEKKMNQMKESIISTRNKIEEMDKENPELSKIYMDKFIEARKATGLSINVNDDTFMKYMVEDADLGF